MISTKEFIAAAHRTPPLRAPYTFVPLARDVRPSPWNGEPDLGRPHPEGLGGELVVEWRVETPILIGGRDNNQPFQLGGTYAVPGASLRGMVRSVLEILAKAHLEPVDNAIFSARDFDSVTWQKVMTQSGLRGEPRHVTLRDGRRMTVQLPKAAWLAKHGDAYTLTESDQEEVPVSCIAAACGVTDDDWHCTSLHHRHALLKASKLDGVIDLGRLSPALAGKRGTLVVAGLIKSEIDRRTNPRIERTNKVKEVAFLAGPAGRSWTIGQSAMKLFDAIQTKDSNRLSGPPRENWSFWQPRLANSQPVPVFFRGDPATAADKAPAPTEFVMGLTRLIRVPHGFSVGQVLVRTQTALKDHGLDLVQALFGHVPEKDAADSRGKGRQRAWRSRVRFEIATPADGQKPRLLPARRAVTMKPRASFFPYYLRPANGSGVTHPVDWSSDKARLAGRKRYPARDGVWPAGQLPQPPNEANAEEQANDLEFLDASPDAPLRLRSRVRFDNLLPEELGGLVWAITLGQHGQQEQRRLRHMLGRGKAFGHGQIHAVVEGDGTVERNDGRERPTLAACMQAFERWVLDGEAGGFRQLPQIRTLLAVCDAALGGALDRAGALDFPRHGTSAEEAKRILDAYQEIKKRASCKPDAQGKHPKRRGGQLIENNPLDEAFLFLPDYPDRDLET